MSLVQGNTIRLKAEFRNWDGDLTDPTGVKVEIYDYYDNKLHEAEPPAVENPEVGKYYYDYELPPSVAIPYYFVYSGTIDGAQAAQRMNITTAMRIDPTLMMKVSDLIDKAEVIVEESYSDEDWESMIDSVLRDLNSAAKVLNSQETAVTLTDGNAYISLPTDLYEIVSVSFVQTGGRSISLRNVSSFDSASAGWYREGVSIYVQNLPFTTGNIKVNYYIALRIFEDGGDKYYPLPERYEHVLLKGLQAMVMQKEEELQRKNDFFQEYMLMKQEMFGERVRTMEPWAVPTILPMGER